MKSGMSPSVVGVTHEAKKLGCHMIWGSHPDISHMHFRKINLISFRSVLLLLICSLIFMSLRYFSNVYPAQKCTHYFDPYSAGPNTFDQKHNGSELEYIIQNTQ